MKFNFDIPEESQEIFSEDGNYFVDNFEPLRKRKGKDSL